ncbi:hypothetical protein [Micromonospora sp. ATCC 39149]|uniref:hypothetical protein n=1 Tax=Micromonospora sp. (strain ATCC 39149 / NRRL 15099 / SCC 1413) TaxID=219305 RepID=UPI001E48BB05|nr:hypothetical protein [Micromonospora sp. ATCC 39149]
MARDNIARAAAAVFPFFIPSARTVSMVNGGNMSPPAGATYVGVGVTTLDSDQGRWDQLARTLREPSAASRHMSVFDLKGQCYALLTDGTALHVDRDPRARLGVDGIRCTKTLDPERISYYNPHATLIEQCDDATREVWRQLGALHHTLTNHLLAGRPA